VLLDEDFQYALPGPPLVDGCATGELAGTGLNLAAACIGSPAIDTYNRSRVQAETASLATVTGGDFADPFAPGANQSLVLHNPFQSTQMAVNIWSIFPDDPAHPNYYLRNGTIEFDVYLKEPQPEALFAFLGVRLGFEADPANRNQVSSTGDQTIWNVFNIYGDAINDPSKQQIASNILLSRASPGFQDNLYDQANNRFFLDPNQAVIAAETALRVRYELDGAAATYRVSVDKLANADPAVDVQWPAGVDASWTKTFNFLTFTNEPAPGVNEISFMTDASAFAVTNVAPDVYLDNLRIVDFDRAPHAPGEIETLPLPGVVTGPASSYADVPAVLEAWEAKSANDGSWLSVELPPGADAVLVEVVDGLLIELGLPSRRGFQDADDAYELAWGDETAALAPGARFEFAEPIGTGQSLQSFVLRGVEANAGAASFPLFLAASGADVTLTPITTGGGASADFNGDGFVDGADLQIWEQSFPLLGDASGAQGDANGDGRIDGADLLLWQREFSMAAGSTLALPEVVGAWWLLVIVGARLQRRRLAQSSGGAATLR
jgi:hypothetical protein